MYYRSKLGALYLNHGLKNRSKTEETAGSFSPVFDKSVREFNFF
jgi:hypothetical protein